MNEQAQQSSAFEVLAVFTRLGLTSFGGPVAHLGYFRNEFVVQRKWLDDRSYADLVALCQFLPGPASSQVGIAVGFLRAGYAGAFAAWVGFTLPSAVARRPLFRKFWTHMPLSVVLSTRTIPSFIRESVVYDMLRPVL